jgi:hypothetical protein
MPKQPSTVKACVKWAQVEGTEEGICVELLYDPKRAAVLAQLRPRHLEVTQLGHEKVFVVVPQVLCVDVLKAINAFEKAVRDSDAEALTYLDEGFEKWWGRASSIRGQLDDAARAYLGIV